MENNVSKRKGLRYDKRIGLLLISPWLIGVIVFKLGPILASLYIAFTDFHLLTPNEISFIGLGNFKKMVEDPAVGYMFFQTIAMVMTTIPFQLLLTIALAKLLSMPRVKGSMMLRTLFFLPSIVPSVVLLAVMVGFFNPTTGWVNRLFLEPLGLDFNIFYDQIANQIMFAFSALWSIGPGLLIIMGALKGVPEDIHESARVDGAGPFTRLFALTLPIISPAILFSLVINLVMAFGGVILLDRGNRYSGSISPIDSYITYQIFDRFDLGYAASLAWVFFAVVMAFIYFILRTSNKWVFFPDSEDQT
jgi:ABC-type sugar transport system permease subunit